MKINGIPDRTVSLNETENCEIALINVSQDEGKIYIWKVFELVYRGEPLNIEYGSNYCLQRGRKFFKYFRFNQNQPFFFRRFHTYFKFLFIGESFKIKMRVRYTSIVTSETLYPIVLKTSTDDINRYNYILIEPVSYFVLFTNMYLFSI